MQVWTICYTLLLCESPLFGTVLDKWLKTGCHRIFKTFHRCFVHIYRYGFKSPARNKKTWNQWVSFISWRPY